MKTRMRKRKTYLKMSNECKGQKQANYLTLQMEMVVATPGATIANLTVKTQLQVPRNELENEQLEERLPNKKVGKL